MQSMKKQNQLGYSPDKQTFQTPMTQATTIYQEESSYAGGVPDLGLQNQARTSSPAKTAVRRPKKERGNMLPSPEHSPTKTAASPTKGKQSSLRPGTATKKKGRPGSYANKRPSEPVNVQMGSAPAFGGQANTYVSQEVYNSPTKNKRLKMAQSMNKELKEGNSPTKSPTKAMGEFDLGCADGQTNMFYNPGFVDKINNI